MDENLMSMDTLVDPFVMKVLICDEFNKESDSAFTYVQLKEYVNNAKVTITRDEIKKYLDKEFEKNCPDLRKRVMEANYSNPVFELFDRIDSEKYMFSEDTFEYFNTYVDIFRDKSLKLLSVVDLLTAIKNNSLGEQDISILSDLDIEVIDGNIMYKDVIRLVSPIVDNISDLKKYVDKANDVDSYLHIHMNRDLICLSGGNFEDLFPPRDLQINDIESDCSSRGMVTLTGKQIEMLHEKHDKNYRYVLSLLDDLK